MGNDELFKFAAESSMNHIIITDSEGAILYANKAAEQLTGFTFEEMKGNTPRLWGKQMSAEFYENLWTTIKKRRISFKGEIINRRKNGEKYTAIATISPIIDQEGQLIGFVGIEEDISELKRTETKLREQAAELESLNKLMVGRELKMVELKDEISKLKKIIEQ